MAALTLSAKGAALIAEFEGAVDHWYRDPVGFWTLGIGHLRTGGEFADVATEDDLSRGRRLSNAEMYDLFIADAARYIADVNRLVSVPLNQNRFDALVSLDFNLGAGGWGGLLGAVNAGDHDDAAARFGRYVYAGGKVLAGLVRRRSAEADLYRAPVVGPEPLPAAYDNIHPIFARRLLRLNAACGTWVYSGWRSSQRQGELYDCWVAREPGCNPANPPGTSNHEAVPYGVPMALGADLAGDLDTARSRAAEFGICFPISNETWHCQPSELTSPTFVGIPDLGEDHAVLPDPKEEPEMSIAVVSVAPGEQVSLPLPSQGSRFGVSMVSITLTAGLEDARARAVIGPDWHGLDPDHPEDLLIPPAGRRWEDVSPESNVLQLKNYSKTQSIGVLIEAR